MNGLSFFYTPCVFFKKGFEQRSLVFPLFFGKGEKQGFFFFSFFVSPFLLSAGKDKRELSLLSFVSETQERKRESKKMRTLFSLWRRESIKKEPFFIFRKREKRQKEGGGRDLVFFCLDKREKKVYRGGLFGIKSSPLSLSFPFSFFSKKKGGKSPSLLLF